MDVDTAPLLPLADGLPTFSGVPPTASESGPVITTTPETRSGRPYRTTRVTLLVLPVNGTCEDPFIFVGTKETTREELLFQPFPSLKSRSDFRWT